jgi:hypothetical protein
VRVGETVLVKGFGVIVLVALRGVIVEEPDGNPDDRVALGVSVAVSVMVPVIVCVVDSGVNKVAKGV